MLSTLLRSWWSRRPQTIRRPSRQRPTRLGFEKLEDRLAPSASKIFAGLEFMTAGSFTTSNHAVTSTDPVQVGVAPTANAKFTPALQLDGGVSFTDNDATGAFSTSGTVSGIAATTLPVLDARLHQFTAPGLLSTTSYFSLANDDTNAPHLAVDGGQFAVTALHLAAAELDLQGTISVGNHVGLTIAIAGNDHVAVTAAGASVAGPDPTVAAETFNAGGVMVTVQSLSAHGDLATNSFDLSGQVTASFADNTVSLTLGTSTAPGLVFTNGQFVSLDASVTSDLKLGGVTVHTDDLAVHYAAGSDLTITGQASAEFAGQKIGLALGSTGADGTVHPGIDVDPATGTLVMLNAGINSDIKVGGVTFKTEALGVRYSPGSDFLITGKAEFDLKDTHAASPDQMIAVTLGGPDGMHSGLDIGPDGSIKSLDAAIDADITVAGLTIKADGLGVTYPTSNGGVAVYGGASFTLGDHSVGVKLGDHANPGLVIADGQLTTLTASVTADISLFGIGLSAHGLTVAYQAPNGNSSESIAIYGDVAVTTKFLSFDSTLGTAADPGILIAGGTLQNLNLTVNGGFSLFGIELAANGLMIHYSHNDPKQPANTLELSGGVTVQFTSAFQISTTLAKGGLIIDTATGALSIDAANGLEIKADAQLGPFSLQGLDITFSTGPGGVNFSAKGAVMLPGGFGVNLTTLDIVNGQLADIGVDIMAKIPIGDTGFFLTEFGGALKNLNNISQLEVDANATIDFGDPITVPSIPGIFHGGNFAVAEASGSIMVNATELKLTGAVSLLGGLLGQGSATLDLNWGSGVYSIAGNFSMYDGIISFGGSLTVTNAGDIDLLAMGSVNVPSIIPFIGGTTLGNINFAVHFVNDGIWGDSYVAAWTNINLFFTSFTIGFKVDFTGNFSIINGSDVASITAPVTATAPAPEPTPIPYTYAQALTIPMQNVSGAQAAGTQVTISAPALNRGYPLVFGTDTLTNFAAQGSGVHLFSEYSLSHQDVLLASLSFGVTIGEADDGTGGLFDGSGSFDQAGHFVFTPSGLTPFVPNGATLFSSGVLALTWAGDPGVTTVHANYSAAGAIIDLFQNAQNGGAPLYVKSYAIDPVTSSALDPVQAAMRAELMNTDTGVAGTVVVQHEGQQATDYRLSHAPADEKTVSFKLYSNGTLLGTGSFDAQLAFHFVPNGTQRVVPASGVLVGNSVVALTWPKAPPPGTSIDVTYASLGNRILDVNLATDTATGGIPGSYVIELIANSIGDPMINPSFSQSDQYQTPTVAIVTDTPAVNAHGQLAGSLLANVFTPAAQQDGDTTATVSLYYNTTDNLATGTPIRTDLYSNFFAPPGPGPRDDRFVWPGFANLPKGDYYVYAVVNDGMNAPVYSPVSGPFPSVGPKPTFPGAGFLALTPGADGLEQGTFSAAAGTPLLLATNFPNLASINNRDPVAIDVTLNGGGSLSPAGATVGVQDFQGSYASAAAANAALDGLHFVADDTFHTATTLTFTAVVTINGTPYKSVETVPLVIPNTHLVVTQSVDTTTPADPDTAVITVTVTNPGGPGGQDGANVQVQNYLTNDVQVLSATASAGSFDTTTGLWTIGNLPMTGANTATLTLTVKADPSTYDTPLSSTAIGQSTLPNYPLADTQSSAALLPQAHAIVIGPATVPQAVRGSPFQVQYTADRGGGGPYTFTVTGGAIPAGLTLSPTGLLAGTTTAPHGIVAFNVTATNPYGVSTSLPVQINPADGPLAVVGTPYTLVLGLSSDSYALLGINPLPPGLSLLLAGGNTVLAGTPTTPGLYPFFFEQAAPDGSVGFLDYHVFVDTPVVPGTPALPSALAGSPYSATFSATGGDGSIAITLAAGSVPPGLTWNGNTLSGTVAATVTPGNYAFSVTDTDGSGASATAGYTIAVRAGLHVPTMLSPATVGSAYQETLTAAGGSGTGYTFAATALPPGLTLSPAGILTGKLSPNTHANTLPLAVTITDSTGSSVTQTLQLATNPPVTVTPADLPDGQGNSAYQATLSATGGTGTGYTFAVTSGQLPPNLALSSTGVLSGAIAATAAGGYYNFAVTATDSQGDTGSVTCTLFVDRTLTVGPATLPKLQVGVPYAQQLTVTGGSGVYAGFTLTAGTLPPNVKLLPAGLIAGTVLATTPAGDFLFTVTATDSIGMTRSVAYHLAIPAINATWTGAASTAWSNPANWSPRAVPGVQSNVTIPSHPLAGRFPTLDQAAVVDALTLQPGATLSLAGHGLTSYGKLTNQGTIVLQGVEPVQLAGGNDTTEGTWQYTGDGTGHAVTLLDFGAADYFNLTIADTHSHRDTFQTAADPRLKSNLSILGGTFAPSGTVFFSGAGAESLNSVGQHFTNLAHDGTGTLTLTGTSLTVNGAFTNSAGTVQTNGYTVTVAGPTTLTGGTFRASGGADHFNGGLVVAGGTFLGSIGAVTTTAVQLQSGTLTAPTTLTDTGDWSVTGGTFNANRSTVVLAGTNQHLTGNTTFFNLTKTTSAADTLTFQAGSTQTIGGALTLRGVTGKRLALRSSSPGSTWSILPLGTATAAFVDVQDSVNLGKKPIVATGAHDSGDNTGWKLT